jgi:hypothetical protein
MARVYFLRIYFLKRSVAEKYIRLTSESKLKVLQLYTALTIRFNPSEH